MIINSLLEPGLFIQFSSGQHHLILGSAVSGNIMDSAIMFSISYCVCVHVMCGSVHVCDTAPCAKLRMKILRHWFSPSIFKWVLGITPRSPGFVGMNFDLKAIDGFLKVSWLYLQEKTVSLLWRNRRCRTLGCCPSSLLLKLFWNPPHRSMVSRSHHCV